MKKLLSTLLFSVGLSGITLGAFAQDSQSGAPASSEPDTFTLSIQYPQPIKILRHVTNDNITFTDNCKNNDNNNCSFQLSGSSGDIGVTIGSDTTNHCVYIIHYEPSAADYFKVAQCGGNLATSGLNHTHHYQYKIYLSQGTSR